MGDNHPAKIAKYLLKGWCLLNEYCPNGQNIPLVRSKDGALICAGCTPSCPYYATHGDQPEASPVRSPAPARPGPPAVERSDRAMPLQPPEPAIQVPSGGDGSLAGGCCGGPTAGGGHHPVASGAHGSAPLSAWSSAGTAPASSEAAVVTFKTPAMRCSIVRLFSGRGQRSRLVGNSLELKVRMAVTARGVEAERHLDVDLREVARSQCDKLDEKVVLPAALCTGVGEHSQTTVACEDGARFVLPGRDCIILDTAQVSLDAIAATVWGWISTAPVAERFHGCGALWLEVSVSETSGAEASFRRALRPGSVAEPPQGRAALDW